MSNDAGRYPIGGAATQSTGIPAAIREQLNTGCDTIWGEIVGHDEPHEATLAGDYLDGWPPWRPTTTRTNHTHQESADDADL